MIHFFAEDIAFKIKKPRKIKNWLKGVINAENYTLNQLNYIFCSDEYLLNINRQYLDHDYYTDIITFDQSDTEGVIEGDIFISIDRVGDNAQLLQKTFDEELHRVIVHGVLHLLGYDDSNDELKSKMRNREDELLLLLNTNS